MWRFAMVLLAVSSGALAVSGESLIDPHFGDHGRAVAGFMESDTPHLRALAKANSGKTWLFADDASAPTSLYLARLLVDGQPDASFDADGQRIVSLPAGLIAQTQSLALEGAFVQSDGKPVIFGGLQPVNSEAGAFPALVCRVTVAGPFEPGFGGNGCRTIRSFLSTSEQCRITDMAQAADGTLVAVGNCRASDLAERPFVARLTTTGAIDTSFGGGAGVITPNPPLASISSQHYTSVRLRPNGSIAVLGQFRMTSNGLSDLEIGVAQFDSGGSPDAGFGGIGFRSVAFDQGGDNDDLARDMVLRPDGKLLVLGQTTVPNPQRTLALLAQFTVAGVADSSFGTNGLYVDDYNSVLGPNGSLRSLDLDSLGRAVVGGTRVIGQPAAMTAAGTDFWIALPPSVVPEQEGRLVITSDVATSGDVVSDFNTFSGHFNVTPGQVTTVILSSSLQLSYDSDVIETKGLHITSAAPIVVNEVHGRPGSMDGTRAMTTAELGKAYRILAWGDGIGDGSLLTAAATQANTTVKITPKVTTVNHPAGVTYSVLLQAGEAYHLSAPNDADLTGSSVTADKPIAVYGGHTGGNVPDGNTDFAEMLNEQQTPVDRWGQDFVLAPYGGRTSSNIVRVLADQAGTAVSVDGVAVATLGAGNFYQFDMAQGTRIHSTRPVAVAQFQKGCKDEPQNCTGDPTMIMIVPTQQWQRRYDAMVTTLAQQAVEYLGVVVPTTAIASVSVNTLVVPAATFTPIGNTGYSSAQIPTNPGAYVVAAAEPMNVYVYGYPSGSAFGYPAAGAPLSSGPNAEAVDTDDVIVRHGAGGPRDSGFGIGGIAVVDHQVYYGSAEPSADLLQTVLVDGDGILVGTASTNGASGQGLLLGYRLLGDVIFRDSFD